MGRHRIERTLRGTEETQELAESLASTLLPNTVIALMGQLGAGKTTFIRGLVRGLGGEEESVQSPTFTYLHCYSTSIPLFHFDLYRLKCADDFLAMGFEEMFDQGGIVAIEWPERIAALLPKDHLQVHLSALSPTERRILII